MSYNDHRRGDQQARILAEQDACERGWLCYLCGDPITELDFTADHVVPKSRGGRTIKGNVRACCLVDNAVKGTRTLGEWEAIFGPAFYRRTRYAA